MESVTGSLLTHPTVLTTLFVGVCVIILVYISKCFRQEDNKVEIKPKNEKSTVRPDKKKETTGKAKKKLTERENRWTARNEKQNFTHPWLLTSLKGHTGHVLDLEFSSNGKYTASCADEDPDPGGMTTESSSSSSESTKENSRPPSTEPSPSSKGLSRRQRKNRRRDTRGDTKYIVESKKKIKPKVPEKPCNKGTVTVEEQPLEEFNMLNMSEGTFAQILRRDYVLRSEDMAILGYPTFPSKRPMISHNLLLICTDNFYFQPKQHYFDINAKEFVPKRNSSDSGRGSGSSSEEESSSSSEDLTCRQTARPVFGRTCTRCGNWFYTTHNKYLSFDGCSYHWGKLRMLERNRGPLNYACCNGGIDSKGCSQARLHVWNGPAEAAVNSGFVETEKLKDNPVDGNFGVYALDCEMSYTVAGLEVTKVTVVGMDGRLAYNEYVRPKNEIVDYNTRFSGITDEHFRTYRTKTLSQVQKDLKKIINSDTVLIGHGLENDLKALKLIHKTVVDTTFTFPHHKGFPYKRALKSLVKYHLKKDIQCSDKGHDSYEDARACMELILYRVRMDCSYNRF